MNRKLVSWVDGVALVVLVLVLQLLRALTGWDEPLGWRRFVIFGLAGVYLLLRPWILSRLDRS